MATVSSDVFRVQQCVADASVLLPILILSDSVTAVTAGAIGFLSAQQFLLRYPRHPYTTTRVFVDQHGNCHMVQKQLHCSRIVQSHNLSSSNSTLTELQLMPVIEAAQQLLQSYVRNSQICNTTLMLCLLLSSTVDAQRQQSLSLHSYINYAPSLPLAVTVAVYGAPRKNALCKHSSWVEQRQPLEAVKAKLGVDEIVLHQQQLLYEGLISNVFVLTKAIAASGQPQQQMLITADSDDVLHGSTRQLVLLAAASANIPVKLQRPDLSDIHNWQCVFICSALRICTPIAALLYAKQERGQQQKHSRGMSRQIPLPLSSAAVDATAFTRHTFDTSAAGLQQLTQLRNKVDKLAATVQ